MDNINKFSTQAKITPSISNLLVEANQLKQGGKLELAIQKYRQAIAFFPKSAWAYYYLGETFVAKNCFNRATVCYRQAIAFNPCIAEFYNQLGEVYLKKDRLDKAIIYFQKAIALQPNEPWYYQNSGEVNAQKGYWTACISCYYDALKLNPLIVQKYNHNLNIKPDDPQTIQVNNPIYVVGCGHSGTSIMLAILGNHPALYPIPYESSMFLRKEPEIRKMMLQWDSECLQWGKKRWLEKTPPHIFQIEKFLKYRPDSQFIIMLRDGRDVVCSLKFREQYQDFTKRVERWIYDNLAGLPYWHHPQVTVVKYEDLIENANLVLGKILNFLGEDNAKNLLDYHLNPKRWYSKEISKPDVIKTHQDHKQMRNWQINQPLFDGRGRWNTDMTPAEKSIFKAKAQEYLVQFGYVKDDVW